MSITVKYKGQTILSEDSVFHRALTTQGTYLEDNIDIECNGGLEPFSVENGVLTRGLKNETSITDKFSSITEIGWQGLFYAYFRCADSVVGTLNLTNLTKVGSGGMLSAFASSSISGFTAPALVEIEANGMKEVCQDTLVAGEVRFTNLEKVGLDGLKNAFVRTLVTKIYFNKLNTCNQTGLSGMLTECDTCTEIHFKSGTQTLIQGLDGYSENFGAANATIYFDL